MPSRPDETTPLGPLDPAPDQGWTPPGETSSAAEAQPARDVASDAAGAPVPSPAALRPVERADGVWAGGVAVSAASSTAPAVHQPRWSGRKTAVAAALAIGLGMGAAAGATAAVALGHDDALGDGVSRIGPGPGGGQGQSGVPGGPGRGGDHDRGGPGLPPGGGSGQPRGATSGDPGDASGPTGTT